MKKNRALEILFSILLVGLFTPIMNGQNQHVYNEVDVTIDDDGNYKPSRGYVLTTGITFNFPEYETPGHAHRAVVIDGTNEVFVDLSEDVQSISYTFTTPGVKTIQVHRWWEQVGYFALYQEFTITVVTTTAPYVSPDEIIPITTDRTWSPIANACNNPYPLFSPYLESDIGEARAYVRYAPGHDAIIKPIIFVDGIDFSDKQIVDEAHGTGNDGIIRYGSTGWDVISMGSNEGGGDPGYLTEFRMYPQTFSEMSDLGYDIIYIDFEKGADYIQKNAILVEEFIKSLNGTASEPGYKQVDPATGLMNGNVILGASMGGLIARMALTRLEQQGIDHCMETYISFDSPHKGGNISLGMQAMAWYLFNIGQHPDIDELFEELDVDGYDKSDLTDIWVKKLNTPGARQLLVEHFAAAYLNGSIKFRNWDGGFQYPLPAAVAFGCLRSSFVEEMDLLGFPKNCRNVAISSGSRYGEGQAYDADDQIFEISANADVNIPLICNIDGNIVKAGVWALNGGNCDYYVFNSQNDNIGINEDKIIFAGAMPDVPDLIEVINVNWPNLCPLDQKGTYAQVDADFPHYDNSPGSYRFDLLDYSFDEGMATFYAGIGLAYDANGGVIDNRERQTFIPTISSIALKGSMGNVNLWKDLSQEDLVATGKTPFDAYYIPETNLKHVEIDQGIIDWLTEELETTGGNIYSVLPHNGQTTYNFGNGVRNQIPSITIQDGAVLGVNMKGNTEYLNAPPSGKYVFETWTRDVCGGSSDILIEAGGKMILGNHLTTSPDDPPAPPPGDNLKGIVHLTAGSTLHVSTGGTLRIARGSQLIVEEGAELIIEEGADIDLWWSASTIYVKGKLTLHGKFDFGGSGFFQFDPTHTLDLVNDVFILYGTTQENRFIRLNGGTVLDIGMGQIDLKNGIIEYDKESQIHLATGGRAIADYVTFRGMDNEGGGKDAIVTDSPGWVDIWNSQFENLTTGIYANGSASSDALVRAFRCDFHNVTQGVWVIDHPKVNIRESNFYGGEYSVNAVQAQDVDFVGFISGEIQNYPEVGSATGAIDLRNVNTTNVISTELLDNHIGVLLSNVPSFSMWGGFISQTNTYANDGLNPNIGIYAPQFAGAENYSNVNLFNGATIENNDAGVWITRGGILDGGQGNYGVVTMKCAKLIHNETGILGIDVLLEVDAMTHSNCENLDYVNSNTFINSWTGNNPEQIFNICYDIYSGDFTEISARGNYWGGFAPNPSFDFTLRNMPCLGPSNITLLFEEYATSPPSACDHNNCGLDVPTPWPGNDTKRLAKGNATEFIVSPNPTLDYFTISWLTQIDKATIEIYNPLGQIVLRRTVENTNQLLVDASDWPSGVYLINVNSGPESKAEMLIIN